jgi:predicted phosphoadenosine phosphosulfate sulfurtransferase
MAIASPALAQRAQSAPQRGYQSHQNGYYNGYPVHEWYHDDVW